MSTILTSNCVLLIQKLKWNMLQIITRNIKFLIHFTSGAEFRWSCCKTTLPVSHSISSVDYFHLFWLICMKNRTCSSVHFHIHVWDCQSWKDFNFDFIAVTFSVYVTRDLMGTIWVRMHFQVFMFWVNTFVL